MRGEHPWNIIQWTENEWAKRPRNFLHVDDELSDDVLALIAAQIGWNDYIRLDSIPALVEAVGLY